ncbi:MAG: NADPH-dependent glutamate synthase [Promethearchaeota archaeon]
MVGTPCMMEAIKKISFYPLNKPFYENISFKIGLFCMESFNYKDILELLENEFQTPPTDIKKMDIDKGRFYLYNKDGSSIDIPLKKIKKYGRLGCFFCDDLTAEQADISVGSIGSESGWSTVIIRTEKGAELFKKALDLDLIEKKEIKEDHKSFISLSKISKSKQKTYKESRRPKMIEQDPNERIHNFNEVPYGLTAEMALKESQRCLQCGRPLCVTGCPVNIDIPGFIRQIKLKKNIDAIHIVKNYNLLPAICGRVCPQEIQCEKTCLLNNLGEPISIGYLERYIADWERENQLKECPDCRPPNSKKVAIIGSGPAGLTCAGELAMRGYDVTIFEAFHAGGGVLVYGIPEFRLPKEIVKAEIETLKLIDVKIHYNSIIGKTLTIEDLREMGFKAFFVGVGAGLPMFLKIPGLNLNGVLTANEFLTRSNLMKAYRFPEYDTPINVGKIVTVVGGGNVAMDSARTALRLGAEKVILVYRRSEAEMPARIEEYHHGKEEGIDFRFLTNPVRLIGDENDNVKEMEVVSMKLGEPDASGRRRPIPIENSEHIIETDTVILAIGANANPILTKSIPELKLNKWRYIETNEKGQTNIDDIFAGGDIVTGSATVISAMGAGKRAAEAIDEYLQNV